MTTGIGKTVIPNFMRLKCDLRMSAASNAARKAGKMFRCPTCGKRVDQPASQEALRLETEIYDLNKLIRSSHASPGDPEWELLQGQYKDLLKHYRRSGGRKDLFTY
jgi:hypothetical protein